MVCPICNGSGVKTLRRGIFTLTESCPRCGGSGTILGSLKLLEAELDRNAAEAVRDFELAVQIAESDVSRKILKNIIWDTRIKERL